MAVINEIKAVLITSLINAGRKSSLVKTSCNKMVKSKKFVLAKYFDGTPKESDFKLVEEELPPIKDKGN